MNTEHAHDSFPRAPGAPGPEGAAGTHGSDSTRTVRLTVNGEPCSATVAGRTQLAELLRDHLHLTGTHLGCEHGVCGACTVLVDGKPIRSCITYAQACEGANVVTVEGLGDDPVGRALGDPLRQATGRAGPERTLAQPSTLAS